MAIDHRGSFTPGLMPRGVGGELSVEGEAPTLILAIDFPLAIGPDGASYDLQGGEDGRVRVLRLAARGTPEVFATPPVATETEPDGKPVPARWIHGLAAGPDGSLCDTERAAVRRIAPDGTVSLVAGSITVPGCVRPPAVSDSAWARRCAASM